MLGIKCLVEAVTTIFFLCVTQDQTYHLQHSRQAPYPETTEAVTGIGRLSVTKD